MGNIFVFSDTDLVTIARVLLAFFLGGVVGIEREWARRPAGLRTHMLVCAGSACFTVASIYGFNSYGTNVDPSRLAAQIITGVGFLGAGAIFRSGTAVRGLTTASSIWITAAIGIVTGLGMLWLALFTTGLTWLALAMVKRLEARHQSGPPRPDSPATVPPGPDDLD